MSDSVSPSNRLHAIVIVHDQTRAEWRASRATIRAGRIVVAASGELDSLTSDLLERRGATFTIIARDGGERTRRYEHLKFEPASSEPPNQFTFN